MPGGNEAGFKREMTLKLYEWVAHIKNGRMAIRQQIEQMQTQQVANQSIKTTAQELLNGEAFRKYFGGTGFSPTDLNSLLNMVHPGQDNLQVFFSHISSLLKTPAFTEQQWRALAKGLIEFKGDRSGFPAVTAEEIKEYLYVAVYFFTLPEGHTDLLEAPPPVAYLCRRS